MFPSPSVCSVPRHLCSFCFSYYDLDPVSTVEQDGHLHYHCLSALGNRAPLHTTCVCYCFYVRICEGLRMRATESKGPPASSGDGQGTRGRRGWHDRSEQERENLFVGETHIR